MTLTEPAPLAPLGETDSWSYANGLIVYYRGGKVYFHNGFDAEPVVVPAKLSHVVYVVGFASGLDHDQASLIREAVENYA